MPKWEGYEAPEGFEYWMPPSCTEPQLRELPADAVPEATAKAESETSQLKGKLPADFPGHAALEEAGLTTYAKVRKQLDSITAVAGIGEATAEKIREAMTHPAEEEEPE